MELRRSQDRGHVHNSWLNSWHSFSFGDYYDPRYIQFRALRVINDDTVEPGQGFGMHGHRDMEIVSYVLEGTLAHKDTTGTRSIIRPGNVQRMSAGTGVQHSEFHPSPTEKVHFLQIWLIPNITGVRPSYEERYFADAEKRGRLRLIASPDGAEDSVTIHSHGKIFAALVNADERVERTIPAHCSVYVHIARGSVSLNGTALLAGDAAIITDASSLTLDHGREAEVLVFELQ